MKNSVTNFRSDITALQGELDHLNATRVQMRMDLSGATQEAKRAKKAFEELGDSATEAERKAAEADWRQAEENLDNIRQQYDLVSRQVRQTTRDMENASGAISRMENRAGPGSTGVLAALGKAGILNMAGDAAGQWANTLVGSAFGSEVGGLFSGALGGAVQGAAMGSLAGPVGTAVGAAVGGGIGLLTGGAQAFEARDDTFKGYVQAATQGQISAMDSSIASGSALAAQRELDAIAFNQLLGDDIGTQYLEDLRAMAASTPMEYGDLTTMSRALATGFGNDPSRMLALMSGIGNAGSSVGIDAQEMAVMAQALSRMQSSDKANLEYLNAFQERGVDVIGMIAGSLGVSQGEVYDMISKGSISGTQAVNIIQQGLGQYAGAMDEMSKTFSGLESTLSDARAEMDNAYGEGFNERRKEGYQEEINYLTGQSGAMIQEANRAMGAWQAELENSKEQYIRDAMDAVLNSEEYKSAMESGTTEGYAQAGKMLMEAKVRGMNEYNASEGAQLMVEYELSLAEGIREDASSNQAYWDAGYRKGQEYTKGLAAGMGEDFSMAMGGGSNPQRSAPSTDDEDTGYIVVGIPGRGGRKVYPDGTEELLAVGMNRIPYDNFPAMLHEGERVLTAREAGEQDRGRKANIQINISGNNFGAGVSADEIAQRLADQIELHLAAGGVS